MKKNRSKLTPMLFCLAAVMSNLMFVDFVFAEQVALPSEIVFIPKTPGVNGVKLETTIYRPEGKGPFPLVVINHGKILEMPTNKSAIALVGPPDIF